MQQNWNKITASSDGNRPENWVGHLVWVWYYGSYVFHADFWWLSLNLVSLSSDAKRVFYVKESHSTLSLALAPLIFNVSQRDTMRRKIKLLFLSQKLCPNLYIVQCLLLADIPVQGNLVQHFLFIKGWHTHPCTGCFLAGPCKDTQTHTHTKTHI